MSRQSTATLNYQLTQFAQGFMNDERETLELAERLAPTVQVPGTSGQYKKFSDANSFQIYNTSRAMGADPARIVFDASDSFYDCKPQALEVTVDSEERRRAGEGENAQSFLDQGKIKALLNSSSLSHVAKVVNKVVGSLQPVADRGNWSDPDVDPIDQLDELIDTLATTCGSVKGIKLTMSISSWRALRNHPKSKARCTGVQVGGITLEQLNSVLAIPVDTGVYAISYNTKALGLAAEKERILSNIVLLTYSAPNPTQYDPSAFKSFTAGPGGIVAVRSWTAPNELYGGHLVDWSEDIVQTSEIAAKRIDIS